MSNQLTLVRRLIKLKKLVAKGKQEQVGICNQVKCSWSQLILTTYFIKWPKFSGSTVFPVPCPELSSKGIAKARDRYITVKHTGDMWTGEYGELRKELLDFLIIEITKDLNRFDTFRLKVGI